MGGAAGGPAGGPLAARRAPSVAPPTAPGPAGAAGRSPARAGAPSPGAGESAPGVPTRPTSLFTLRRLAALLIGALVLSWFAPRMFASAGLGSSSTGFAGATTGVVVLGVTFVLAKGVRGFVGQRASRAPAHVQDVVWMVAVLGIAAGLVWVLG